MLNNTASELLLNMMQKTQDSYYYPDREADIELQKAAKLSQDMMTDLRSIKSISKPEIKILVDSFYQIQNIRKGTREQIRAIEQGRTGGGSEYATNVAILDWVNQNTSVIESGIEKCLEMICLSTEVGQWLLLTTAIGPVLGAGLMSYLDVTKAYYATGFINYAGLNDNNRPWLGKEKSEKIVREVVGKSRTITNDMVIEISRLSQWKFDDLRKRAFNEKTERWSKKDLINACARIPYNKGLKTHMWKVGDSFHYRMSNLNSLYGALFAERMAKEIDMNEKGLLAEQAALQLQKKDYGKNTIAYKAYIEGKLPKAHIISRARRWTEKIFLSHLFEEMYRVEYDKIPQRHYAVEKVPGHHHDILPEVPYHPVTGEDVPSWADQIAKLNEEREANKAKMREMKKKKKELEEEARLAEESYKQLISDEFNEDINPNEEFIDD